MAKMTEKERIQLNYSLMFQARRTVPRSSLPDRSTGSAEFIDVNASVRIDLERHTLKLSVDCAIQDDLDSDTMFDKNSR